MAASRPGLHRTSTVLANVWRLAAGLLNHSDRACKQWHSPYPPQQRKAALVSIGLRGMLKEHHFRIVAWQDFSDWEAAKIERIVHETVAAACTGRWPGAEVMQDE
jgi:hypothetical protein